MAASLGLFDGTGFDREAVRRAGLPERLLPEVSEEAELGGGRLRVFAALGDNQASFLGAGQGRLDAPLINIGTGSQFSFFTKEHRTVPGLETRPFPGGWLLTGAPLCGGRSFALLERFFRQTAELVTGTPCPSAYPAMLRALEAPMPDDVPQFRTTFAGTRQDPAERAVLSGLDEENFAPVPLLHALLRGMADAAFRLLPRCAQSRMCARRAAAWLRQRSAAQSRPAACRREELRSAAHAGCRPGGGRLRRSAVYPYAA